MTRSWGGLGWARGWASLADKSRLKTRPYVQEGKVNYELGTSGDTVWMGDGDRETAGHRGGSGDPGGDLEGEFEGLELLWSGEEFDVPVVRGA